MEQLLTWDKELLVWINAHHTEALDTWMWTNSQASAWVGLYIVLILLLAFLYRGDKSWKSWLPCIIVISAVAASAGLADFISSGILKPLIARPRPTHTDGLQDILHIVNGYRGGHYGFPSSHAADTTAVATSVTAFWLLSWKACGRSQWTAILAGVTLYLLYVLPNCYSRMYLGVHYPLDIFVGILIGIACALIIYFPIKHFYFKKYLPTIKQ